MTNPRDTLNKDQAYETAIDTMMLGLTALVAVPLALALSPVLAALWLIGRVAQKMGMHGQG